MVDKGICYGWNPPPLAAPRPPPPKTQPPPPLKAVREWEGVRTWPDAMPPPPVSWRPSLYHPSLWDWCKPWWDLQRRLDTQL